MAEQKKENKSTRRPQVNSSCIWCGACIQIAPEVFEYTEEYLSKVKKLDNYEWKNVDDAIGACPTDAIKWIEMK